MIEIWFLHIIRDIKMKKEELKRLKAGLLTCLLLLSMNACSKSEDKKEKIQNEIITQPLDINNYLIVFL